jgi:hypothetical protein
MANAIPVNAPKTKKDKQAPDEAPATPTGFNTKGGVQVPTHDAIREDH